MATENQKIKLLRLIQILNEESDEQHPLTMKDIVEKLSLYGISAERKSLYSDIQNLYDFGYDIVSHKAGKTFYYYMASREFELPELKLLVDSVQSAKFITERKSKQLIKKLEGLTSIYNAKQLSRQVYVSGRIKTQNESIYYNVDKLHMAIGDNKKISFDYFHWNEKKEQVLGHDGKRYEVSPWALSWDDENYYLIAHESESDTIRHYRVDKMLRINILSDNREGKEHFKSFDMANYAKKTFGMFAGNEERVTLLCDNSMAGVMIDRFGKDVSLVKKDASHFTVSVKVALSPQFFGWVFSLGGEVVISSPKKVVSQYKEEIKKALGQY